jgi:hypothetical protein
MSSGAGETSEELLAFSKAHSYAVTATQLARWHREGLLPYPEWRSLGKGRGTQTVYPPGSGKQLLALCAIHAQERRLDYVAWHLWWADYDIPLKRIRVFLGRMMKQWDDYVRDLVDSETGELSEAAWKLVDNAAEGRLEKPLSKARKRVGKKRFDTFMRLAFEAASGTFGGFSNEPEEDSKDEEGSILEQGLGLERARIDHAGDVEPWLKENLEATLKEMSQLLGTKALKRGLTNLTDEQLLEVREQASMWLALLGGYSLMFDKMLGRGAFGLSAVGEAIRDMEPPDQAMWLLAWAISRYEGPERLREGIEALGKPTQEMQEGLCGWELAERLRREVPALSDVLSSQRLRTALRSSEERERYEAELIEVSRGIAETKE